MKNYFFSLILLNFLFLNISSSETNTPPNSPISANSQKTFDSVFEPHVLDESDDDNESDNNFNNTKINPDLFNQQRDIFAKKILEMYEKSPNELIKLLTRIIVENHKVIRSSFLSEPNILLFENEEFFDRDLVYLSAFKEALTCVYLNKKN